MTALERSYNTLKSSIYRMRVALRDTDPAATKDAWFELHIQEGVLTYMEDQIKEEKNGN